MVLAIRRGIEEEIEARRIVQDAAGIKSETQYVTQEFLSELETEMLAAAEKLEFERAAQLRDRILQLKEQMGRTVPEGDADQPGFAANDNRRKKRRKKGRRGKRVPKPERP